MTTVPELHRALPIDRIASSGAEMLVEANAEECAALARRYAIPAVLSLACKFRVTPAGADAFDAHGVLAARVVRECVVSLDEFETDVEEAFVVRFVPEGRESDDPDPERPDDIAYVGRALDLGEAAAEQLALALDPYPRKPGAEPPVSVEDAPETPFAGLASLRRTH
jgi:uncharacterized metal-binding protein YceD (DUF177 family)